MYLTLLFFKEMTVVLLLCAFALTIISVHYPYYYLSNLLELTKRIIYIFSVSGTCKPRRQFIVLK